MIAVSAALRKAVIGQFNCECVAIVDLDTLAMTSAVAGLNQVAISIVDTTGLAYVAATGSMGATAGTSTISAVDLRTGQSTSYPVSGFGVVDMVANAAGTRLYLIGTNVFGIAQWKLGFVQAFDVASGMTIGMPSALGREAMQVLASAKGDELYVLGHVELLRSEIPAPDPRRTSIRPAVFVLDATSLGVKRTAVLADTTNVNLFGPRMAGSMAIDPATNVAYVVDVFNKRFSVVDTASGSVRTVDLESMGFAIAVNPVNKTVAISLIMAGVAAIHSLAGDRLDTVPIATATPPGHLNGFYGAAADALGNTYFSTPYDQSIAVLRYQPDATAGIVNVTDLWSSPLEPGWGVFLQQQGSSLLAALFIHDASGAPAWLVMPNGARQKDGSFSGDLYRTHGPVARALQNVESVGTLRFTASTEGTATLSYTADGASVTKAVQRLRFDAAARTCAWSVAGADAPLAPSSNFTALWWNPAEPGWGLAVSQQGNTTFGVLFGYDAADRASWTVLSNGARKSASAFAGSLYRAPIGAVQEVGTLALDFSGSDGGLVNYRLDGVDNAKPIVRQEFSALSSRCSS
jgi:hypothetical protein